MLGIHDLWLFIVSGLVLNITPGPDTVYIFNGTLWCLVVAVAAARASSRMRRFEGAMLWINRGLGAMFVFLGARIALAQAK